MTFIHTDVTGRTIDVGDIVIFPDTGAGYSVPGLEFGRVLGFTKTTVKVQPLTHYLTEKMREDGFWQGTGQYRASYSGRQIEITEFVKTGEVPVEPKSVKNLTGRFFILQKI